MPTLGDNPLTQEQKDQLKKNEINIRKLKALIQDAENAGIPVEQAKQQLLEAEEKNRKLIAVYVE
jgi:hypothetical protein